MERGKLVVYTGFSGVGKGTVLKRIRELDDSVKLSVSCTTREPRGTSPFRMRMSAAEARKHFSGHSSHTRYVFKMPMADIIAQFKAPHTAVRRSRPPSQRRLPPARVSAQLR